MTAMHDKTEIHFEEDGKKVRFTSFVDEKSLQFEAELRQRKRQIPQSDEKEMPIDICLQQSCEWLKHCDNEYRLVQVSSSDGAPIGQLSFLILRPRRLKWFPTAIVSSFGCSFVTREDEKWVLDLVPTLLRKYTNVTRLRLRAYRPHQRDLCDFEWIARRSGYKIVDPMGVTRTLFFGLQPSLDEILASFDQKTRAKIRHAGREKVEITRLTDMKWVPEMRKALSASFSRTGDYSAYFDYEPFFKLQQQNPDQVLILGLFLKDRPDALLAYSIDIRHGTLVEAVSSGSFPDPELRKLHFNYFLFWEKVKWARDGSSQFLDMGGITDGSSTDPLAGISFFKRHLSRTELEVGREMEKVIRPFRAKVFQSLIQLKGTLQK